MSVTRFSLAALVVSGAALLSAHIGSPDTYFEGAAGPYPVRVIIRAPQVIPARAEVIVRVTGSGVTKVTAAPYIWNGGDKGAPPPDALLRVAGDSTLWSTHLWIMVSSSYSVRVRVEGSQGSGEVAVPLTAVATAVLKMDPKMEIGLAAFGAFLVFGLLTIVGTAARESTLEPGAVPDAAQVRRSWIARGIAATLIVTFLLLGRMWWNYDEANYARGIFTPAKGAVTIRDDAGTRRLRFLIDSGSYGLRRSTSPLIPDHGKLMHLFLVKEDQSALAHLHPVAQGEYQFDVALPVLPAGRYKVYADVVHETGFAETMVSDVDVPAGGATTKASDADDATFSGTPTGRKAKIADGATVEWERGDAPIVAGAEAPLSFVVRDAKGATVQVEPFLGMAAHAVVVRDSADVFVHLHPVGTASMAAQQALAERTAADTLRGALAKRLTAKPVPHTTHAMLPGAFGFPYAFPKAGTYRVWVQFRRGGVIHTAPFETEVVAGR